MPPAAVVRGVQSAAHGGSGAASSGGSSGWEDFEADFAPATAALGNDHSSSGVLVSRELSQRRSGDRLGSNGAGSGGALGGHWA